MRDFLPTRFGDEPSSIPPAIIGAMPHPEEVAGGRAGAAAN
jgi:hypothetical protein